MEENEQLILSLLDEGESTTLGHIYFFYTGTAIWKKVLAGNVHAGRVEVLMRMQRFQFATRIVLYMQCLVGH